MNEDIFQGAVLKPTRAGSSNSSETVVPISGVVREVSPPPAEYGLSYPDVVDIGLQRYKAAILDQEDPSTQYMLWAANSSNIARIDDPTWSLLGGSGKIPNGSNVVIDPQSTDEEGASKVRRDGTTYLIVRDSQERSLSRILEITVRNGGTQALEVLLENVDFGVLNIEAGLVQIWDTVKTQTLLDPYSGLPSMSNLRGDAVIEVNYVLAPQVFWWSRNDPQKTRFEWSDATQSWRLLKGSAPIEVGVLASGTQYTLSPKPTGLVVGTDLLPKYLPGSSEGDAWSMLRVGASPDANSFPVASNPLGVFDGVLVVSDYTSKETYDFGVASPPFAAVIGVTNGLIQWNPAFVDLYAGQVIWYNFITFQNKDSGLVGNLLTAKDSVLFISPTPRVYERPMVRIGSRKYLDTLLVKTEAELALTTVAPGRVGVAISTGRLKFNSLDIAKSDYSDPNFDPAYLNDQVFFDGVALNAVAQPPRPAVILEDSVGGTTIGSSNVFYVPNANSFLGLGTSGIEQVYDGTGASPASGVASVRPGGDDPQDPYTGLKRQVVGLSSPLIFTKAGPITDLVVVDREADLPQVRFKALDNTVYITKENVFEGSFRGSQVELSKNERSKLDGEVLYYQQPYFTPSFYTSQATIYSRLFDLFILDGTEKLYFSLDSVPYVWESSTLVGVSPYSAEQISASIDDLINTNPGRSYAFSGHVAIEAEDPSNGSIEFGLGTGGSEDLSGAIALGFLPGWRVDTTNSDSYWIPDSGVSFGLSPNLTYDSSVPDFRLLGRLEDEILQKAISPSDFAFVSPIPLKDLPGYAQDQFFRTQEGDNLVDLVNYGEVLHDFEQSGKFSWLSEHTESQEVSRPTSFLYLGKKNIVEAGFLPSMGSRLRLSEGGSLLVDQTLNVDFILDSQTGIATFTDSAGGLSRKGYRGSFTEFTNLFEDPDADFVAAGVTEGYQLKILQGVGVGTYLVQSVVNSTSLIVSPDFLETTVTPSSWEIYEGYPLSVYDPSLIADVLYESFEHLSEEPFIIRLLNPLGTVPVDEPAQTSSRLIAEVSQALELGREFTLRVAPQSRTKSWDLGAAVNGSLIFPTVGTGSYFYDFELFSLSVGTQEFRPGDDYFDKVDTFSSINSMVSNHIEWIKSTGELQFHPNYLGKSVTFLEDEVSPTLIGGYEISVSLLGKQKLGVIANSKLFVPEVGSTRFIGGSFSLQIGGDALSQGANLYEVSAFTDPIPANDVQYLSSTGEIGFGADILDQYSLALVYYVEEFLEPSLLGSRRAEMTSEGELNLSLLDITEFSQQPIYFVQQVKTKAPDTIINPIDGSFSFLQPVSSGQIVESEVFKASIEGGLCVDVNGDATPLRTVLPVFISGELCTRVTDSIYQYNSIGSTLFEPFTPLIYVGAVQKNRGINVDCVVTSDQIVFSEPITDSATKVKITYAVLESRGGETAYATSTKPVYRPPFFLGAGQNTFELGGDRTSEMVPGKLLRIGSEAFYLTSGAYDSTTNLTTVEISPSPIREVGSRSPGKDLVLGLSSLPINDGNFAFLLDLSLPYKPVEKNQRKISFSGDITSLAVPGHILQIDGEPFIIAGSEYNDPSAQTIITITSTFLREYQYPTHPTKISARPIYPSDSQLFLGPGQVVGDNYELVLFGETQGPTPLPGRTLVPEKHYIIESGTGNLRFLSPLQEGIKTGQSLYLRYLKARMLQPLVSNGVILYPRFQAQFTYVQIPEETKKQTLLGSYSYYKPDTFFSDIVPLVDYAAQVSQEESQKAQSQNPGGGGLVFSQAGVSGEKGGTDSTSKIRTALDRDRVGRLYLDFYNQVIVAFEQLYEGITGIIIGDRDGKFRFFVGRFIDVPPQGYEDVITGYLNERSLWSEVFKAHTGSSYPLVATLQDDIVNPTTATLSGGLLTGTFLDPRSLSDLLEEQKSLVKNDIDDIALLRTGNVQTFFVPGTFPLQQRFSATGVHQRMALPHSMSRIFPLKTRAFTTTYPGLNADVVSPGVYSSNYTYVDSYGNTVTSSTYNKPIAQLGNPILGDLSHIQKSTVSYRLPRARVWEYRPDGYPELGVTAPCIVASMVPLAEFPLTTEGVPDTQYLMSVSLPIPGSKYDLSSGNPDLHIPPFESVTASGVEDFYSVGKPQRLALGKPDGTIINLASTQEIFDLSGEKVLSGVFVDEVLQGCLITLRTPSNPILNPNFILQTIERGDTIFVVPNEVFEASPVVEVNPQSPSIFRIGTDVGLNSETGELLDITPLNMFGGINTSPVSRLLGPNPPQPLRTIEGLIEYQNSNLAPTEIPALLGQDKNDSGDYTLPFIGSDLLELKLLKEIFDFFVKLKGDTPLPNALYPAEFLVNDGIVLDAVSGLLNPGVLITQTDMVPSLSSPYVPYSGIGDLRPYDFLFVQTDTPEGGHQGLLSVGEVYNNPILGTWIHPPRFVTQSLKSELVRYKLDNFAVHLGPVGFITITEVAGDTRITIDPTVALILDDGSDTGVGGMNSLFDTASFGWVPENFVFLDFYDTGTGLLKERITLTGDKAAGLFVSETQEFPGTSTFPSAPQFFSKEIVIPIIGWVDASLLGVPFHFAFSVDTQDALATASVTSDWLGSKTAFISENRIDFNECYDLSKAAPEGTVTTGTPGGVSVQTELSVMTVGAADLEVNAPAEVNDSSPFTFLETSGVLGTFAPASIAGAGDENATLRVTAFRGYGNQNLSLSNITFAGIPSSDQDENGVIFQGSGDADSAEDMKLTALTTTSGDLDNVKQGDVLVIKTGPGGVATSKAGTYLVRKAVKENNPGYKEIVTTAYTGGGSGWATGWVDIEFPRVVSVILGPDELEVSSNFALLDSFPASGIVYVLTHPENVTSVVPADYALTCVSASYSSISASLSGGTFTLSGSYWDAAGAVILDTVFAAAIEAGMQVSGMLSFPINLDPEVGLASMVPYGMVGVEYTSDLASNSFALEISPAPTPEALGVTAKAPVNFFSFTPDPFAPYFLNIPGTLDFTSVTGTTWDTLHQIGRVWCILPKETLTLTFQAEAGIFLEPTVPRSVFDLGAVNPHVVDNTPHSLTVPEMGFRGAAGPESVEIEIRRIRRFHEPLQKIALGFENLRYINEVRTGLVDIYLTTPNQYGLVTSSSGSNLGPFDDRKVNVKAGDLFRLLSSDGEVLEEVPIASVLSSTELLLSPPGIQTATPTGLSFEVYLKNAPVPYGQTVEQLLEIATEKTLLRRVANLSTNSGGYVDTLNELRDSTSQGYLTLGVQVGDLVVIDPAGEIVVSPREIGSRPLGDVSVASRVADHVPGSPSPLDDNRGFYRVLAVDNDFLTLTGVSSFAGDSGSEVIFWPSTGNDYVLYPTVSDSLLTGGVEGQNDLRPTAYLNGGTFAGDPESIAPFSYKIIRPRSLLSDEAIDLILMERDRMLSWVEFLNESVQDLGGTYYLFQLNNQIEDLTLGTLSNPQMDELGGLIGSSPFANNSSCLSVLDRRFWIGDFDLDFTTPLGSGITYTDFRGGVGRPVLPDQIELVLDFRDKLRKKRLSWVRFRAHLVEGTLSEIDRESQRGESNKSLISNLKLLKGNS